MKKPTTFKGWQKLYPDSIKIEVSSNRFLSNIELVSLTFCPKSGAKVLQNTSTGSWTSNKGTKVINRAIVSKLAAGAQNEELNATSERPAPLK